MLSKMLSSDRMDHLTKPSIENAASISLQLSETTTVNGSLIVIVIVRLAHALNCSIHFASLVD